METKAQFVLITGGTGLVGKSIISLLQKQKINYKVLTRSKNKCSPNSQYAYWNPSSKEIETSLLQKTTDIIHLAGANIIKTTWNKKGKKEIIDSRIETAQFLLDELLKHQIKLNAFISASAVGYYHISDKEKVYSEDDSSSADNFLNQVCTAWEKQADKFEIISQRVVKLRLGIIFAPENSAFTPIRLPFKFGINLLFGNGTQYLPWIHIYDVASIITLMLTNINLNGVFNAVSPKPISSKALSEAIKNHLKIKTLNIYIPSFFVKLILGEKSELLLEGIQVDAHKIKQYYTFRYSTINEALQDLV